MAENEKDKFNWKAGDFQATLSQCSDCDNDISIDECTVYGEKPDIYSENKVICPEKSK